MRTQKQVCVSCRAYIFILRTFCLNACRSSCICHWADYPGSRGSVLSHLAWINQTGTERRSHRRRLLIRKPHTLSLVRLFVYNPLGGFMLFTACLQERTAGGRGLQGLFETDSLISSLVTGSRHETEKKLSDKNWAHILYEPLTSLRFFYSLTRMFPHCSVANTNPTIC